MKVSTGQPVKAAHFNAISERVDSLAPPQAATSTGYLFARHDPYRTVPDFSGTVSPSGYVSVSPGTVYVNGEIVDGDDIPSRHTSITNYTSTSSQPAADGLTAWLWGYAKFSDDAELTAVFKIVWTSSADKEPEKPGVDDTFTKYALPIITVHTNSAGIPYVYQYFTGPQYLTIYQEPDLAQYLTGDQTKPDTPGLVAGIRRIPYAEWTANATTNVDGTYDTSTSGIEYIEDGVIYLREPADSTLAQYLAQDASKTDTPGLIAAIQRIPAASWTANATTNVDGTYDLATSGIEYIEDGVIYLREPVQYPLAQYSTGDATKPDTPGIIKGITYTSGIESPYIANGTINIPSSGGGGAETPLAQYLAQDTSKTNTPGKIAGIQRIAFSSWTSNATTNVDGTYDLATSGIEYIEDGVIYLREPVQYPLAQYSTGDATKPDTPGIIAGITYTSGIESPYIANGTINIPSSGGGGSGSEGTGLHGIRTVSGTDLVWADMAIGHAYKIGSSPAYGQNGTDEIHPTATYAILNQNGDQNYLTLITMVGSAYTSPSSLDSVISNTYPLHS